MSILSGFSTPHAGQRRILTHFRVFAVDQVPTAVNQPEYGEWKGTANALRNTVGYTDDAVMQSRVRVADYENGKLILKSLYPHDFDSKGDFAAYDLKELYFDAIQIDDEGSATTDASTQQASKDAEVDWSTIDAELDRMRGGVYGWSYGAWGVNPDWDNWKTVNKWTSDIQSIKLVPFIFTSQCCTL